MFKALHKSRKTLERLKVDYATVSLMSYPLLLKRSKPKHGCKDNATAATDRIQYVISQDDSQCLFSLTAHTNI